MKEQLLIVMIADALREDLVDALIQCDWLQGFSQYEINTGTRSYRVLNWGVIPNLTFLVSRTRSGST